MQRILVDQRGINFPAGWDTDNARGALLQMVAARLRIEARAAREQCDLAARALCWITGRFLSQRNHGTGHCSCLGHGSVTDSNRTLLPSGTRLYVAICRWRMSW